MTFIIVPKGVYLCENINNVSFLIKYGISHRIEIRQIFSRRARNTIKKEKWRMRENEIGYWRRNWRPYIFPEIQRKRFIRAAKNSEMRKNRGLKRKYSVKAISK